jgi:dynamin 1-like protein
MESLIPIINKLQDVFHTVGSDIIGLPQIAVVGCQSSGKSSVLESFVGKDFLPRGTGIVTRRPLILQLIHDNDPKAREWGVFLHRPDKQFTDFAAIQAEIIAETDRGTGGGRNISPLPIRLKLHSPNVLDLTVVDLPGLVKNAVDGQDPAIVEQISQMVVSFISKPNALILAVTPATEDLANSDALRLARQFDQEGDRTVGVITKIDLMDAGTSARDVLENRVYPLKLGYIGVVNRSQSELNQRTSVASARKKERDFFDNSRDYSDLADRCGSAYLVSVLNNLLMEHIRGCMPALRQRVQALLLEKERELRGYGENPTASRATMNAFVLDVITKYLDAYQDLMHGRACDRSVELADMESRGGARISRIFLDQYIPALNSLSGPTAITETEMFWAMRNHAGLAVPLFTPNCAFDAVVESVIEEFRAPSFDLIDRVVALLFEIHAQVDFMELTRFTALADAIRGVVDDCIRTCVGPTREYVSGLIENEMTFVNSKRPDFVSPKVAYGTAKDDPRHRQLPEKPAVPEPVAIATAYGTAKTPTAHQNAVMKNLLLTAGRYFDLVRDQVKDLVPKAIVKFLVEGSTQLLRPKMQDALFTSVDIAELLQEDQVITRKRIACQQIVGALRKAQDILSEVRAFKA